MSFPLDALTTVYMWFSFFGFVLSLFAVTTVYAFNASRNAVKSRAWYGRLMIAPLAFFTLAVGLWVFRISVA